MKNIFKGLVDIRKGEIGITVLMLANYYLILTTYYFLKPARDSLFLVRVEAEQLPLVFIIIALVIAPITTLYSKAARKLPLHYLINVTTAVLIINLLILRWLITYDAIWVYYLFYVWVSIYGVLTTSQFWLLANAVYDAAQAKRLFVLLGLAGIIGAITGGSVTSLIVSEFGVTTEDLLLFCMGFLAVTMVLVTAVWKMRSLDPDEIPARRHVRVEQKESMLESFQLIRKSRHLLLIVGIIALTMMVASFVDYQFKFVARENFETKDELTSFLGSFYSGLSLVSLLLQAVFAHRLLRILGVGGVILFLPVSLMIASGAVLLAPASLLLVAAVMLRGADGGLKYSLDKTARELLFLPVPLAIKKKTKVFIDMFVDRWFRGFAGGLLLLFTLVLGFGARELSIVVMVLVAVWIGLALVMRKEYVNTFRTALRRREIDLGEVRQSITESSTLATLMKSLESSNEREVAYALDMLRDVSRADLARPVRSLLRHDSADVRRKALQVLLSHPAEEVAGDISNLVYDPDPEVRREAVHYLLDHGEGERVDKMHVFLDHPDVNVRFAAVECIAIDGTAVEKKMVGRELVESLLQEKEEDSVPGREQLARALALLPLPGRHGYIHRLLRDPSPRVVREAMVTAGKIKDREFVPWLLEQLGNRHSRSAAREALAAYGRGVIGTLRDYLLDRSVDMKIRRNIPRVFGSIPRQESVDILTEAVPEVEPGLKYFVVKGLNSLRSRYADLQFDRQRIDRVLVQETRTYYETLMVLENCRCDGPGDSMRLLQRALTEKLDQNLEEIFRLLGLRYPPKDIYGAYLGLVSNKRALRASAVEFLDNVLSGSLKKYLFPIIDEASPEAAIRRGRELFGVELTSRRDALAHLIKGSDSWLKACAIFQLAAEPEDDLMTLVREAQSDLDPVVRETASHVMARAGRS